MAREIGFERAARALESAKGHLASGADQNRVDALIANIRLNESVRLSVAEAAKLLYPKNEASEAQENLRRFRMHVNNAFKAAGLKTVFAVDSNKKISAEERETWLGEAVDESEYIEAFNRQNTADLEMDKSVDQNAIAVNSNEFLLDKNTIKFFISSAEVDKKVAMEVVAGLKKNFEAASKVDGRKYELWNYKDELLVGDLFDKEIEKAIGECHFGIGLVSLDFLISNYIKDKELPNFVSDSGKILKRLYPVPLGVFDIATQVPEKLRKIQFFKRKDAGLEFYERLDEPERNDFIHELYLQIKKSLDKELLWLSKISGEDVLLSVSKLQCEDLPDCLIDSNATQRGMQNAVNIESTTIGESAFTIVEEWIQNPNDAPFMAILGEYGMGKTTLCKKITKELTEKRQKDSDILPVYFDLRYLRFTDVQKQALPTLETMLEIIIQNGWSGVDLSEHFKNTKELIEYIKTKKALVIFDGIDEVIVHLSEASANDFIRKLFGIFDPVKLQKKQYSELPKAIFTCRSHYFKSISDEISYFKSQDRDGMKEEFYKACILLPFDDTQINEYLQKKFGAGEAARITELMQSTYDLSETAKRPLNLKMITELLPDIESASVKNGAVYSVDLYKTLVSRSLSRDDGKHTFSIEHKSVILSHLAAYMWRIGARELEYTKLSKWLDEFLTQNQTIGYAYASKEVELLKEDLRTAAFLTRQNSDRFAFAHTSIQEYFLALYLYESFEKNEKTRWEMGKPSMESFEFLRQLCKQGGAEEPKSRVKGWLAIHNAKSSVNIFYFWIYLQQKGEIFRLPYLDMSGENLKGLELTGAKFFVDEAKFVGSKLQEAEIIALNSDRIDFSQAIADRAFFEGCEFEGVFADSSLAGATFKGCALGKSAFEGATLYGAIFAGCELQNVYMLDKTNVRFVECDTQDSTEKMEVKNLNPAVYLGHSNAVSSVYTDDKRIYSGSHDNTVKVWDSKTFEELATLEGHTKWVTSVYADDKRIYSGSHDDTVKVWDIKTFEEIATLKGHSSFVSSIYADDKLIYSGSWDCTIKIWDIKTFEEISTIKGYTGLITSVYADDKRMYLGSSYKTATVWDTKTFKKIVTLREYGGGLASIYADDKRIYSGSWGNTIKVWDSQTFEEIATLKGHTEVVFDIYADDKRIYSASHDDTVKIWDSKTFREITTLKHGGGIASIYADDKQISLTYHFGGTVKIWDSRTFKEIVMPSGYRHREPASVNRGYKRADGAIKVLDPKTSEEIAIIFNIDADNCASIDLKKNEFAYMSEGAWRVCGYETKLTDSVYRRLPIPPSKIGKK